MKPKLFALNNALLFLCVSMYLGTGWSMVLFTFPIRSQLTVANYYLQFVPQVTAATHFFTYMTLLMMACCVVMLVGEWRSRLRWVPIVVLLAVFVATGLTMAVILPLNNIMSHGITDPAQLNSVLDQWMFLNRIRVSLWTVQWAAMMIYYGVKALAAEDRP